MGVCCSKKNEPFVASNDSIVPKENPRTKKKNKIKVVEKKEVKFSQQIPKEKEAEAEAEATPPMDKKPVFVIAHNTKQASSTNPTTKSEEKSRKEEMELDVKNHVAGNSASVVVPNAEQARTSSCAKEELDAILLQCGGLGRNYSGRKRSYDFDNEMSSRDEEEHWDQKKQQQSEPSPHPRTPSRERGSQQRVSRSPVRRSESPAAPSSSYSSNCDQSRLPPTKMVLVPAREKRTPNTAATAIAAKKVTNVVPNRRNVAPRSKSLKSTRISNEKALAHYPTHSRSLSKISPKKAEQSPCRRNPLTEIGGNSINRVHKSKEGEWVRKATQNEPQTNWITRGSNSVHDQLPSCRTKKQLEPEIHEDAREPKGRSEADSLDQVRTRSSRDFDNNHVNAATYTSLLLEDINNYHQRNASLSLPACVYKARSILEAVADLNSSSSKQSNSDNGQFGKKVPTQKESFVESEIAVKDDLMEPTLHKYITVRDLRRETEPQESTGSNSFIRQPWTSSWELNNSVDSTDYHSTSHFNIHKEERDIEEEESLAVAVCDFDIQCRGSNSNSILSGTTSSATKNRQLHCGGSGGNGKCGSRAYPSSVAIIEERGKKVFR